VGHEAGRYLAGQVTEIRLLAHLARLRWAKSLISTLIAAALLLVANNQANLADVTCAATRVNTVEDDVSQARGSSATTNVGLPPDAFYLHAPFGRVEPNTVVTFSGWLARVVTSLASTSLALPGLLVGSVTCQVAHWELRRRAERR